MQVQLCGLQLISADNALLYQRARLFHLQLRSSYSSFRAGNGRLHIIDILGVLGIVNGKQYLPGLDFLALIHHYLFDIAVYLRTDINILRTLQLRGVFRIQGSG